MDGLLGWLVAGVMAAVGGSEPPAAQGPRVVVTVAPLRGLVGPLAPGAEVKVLMPPGRSEHGYELTPGDVAALAQADLVVRVGLGVDDVVGRALSRQPRAGRGEVVFAEVAGIAAPAAPGHDGHDAHEGEGDHEHGEACEHGAADPHLWLDPTLCLKLVDAAGAALKRTGKVEAGAVDAAAASQRAMIEGVDRAWREGLAGYRGRAIVTHHDAFSRPAAHYGFRVAATIRGLDHGEPTPGRLAEVVRAIRAEGVGEVLLEPQYPEAAARRLATSAGVRVGRVDPLGDGDWQAMMEANLRAIRSALAAASTRAAPGEKEKADGPPAPGGG